MDASITSLTLETKSMRSDIAGFQSRVTGLEQRMGSLETQINMSQEREQDLLHLRSKLTDMEDRSRRDNIRVLGIPENEEGSDMQAFLTSTLPKMISLDFDPPLEFQRAHRIGPKRSDNSSWPRPIIACLLRHNQTRQILQVARNHGPFRIDQHKIRITADYSKETNERRKAFLALRPRLRKLEMKYGLFDPARMWVTKNGVSKDFYNPDELRLFLDSFQSQPMDSLNKDSEHDIAGGSERVETPHSGMEKVQTALYDTGASHRVQYVVAQDAVHYIAAYLAACGGSRKFGLNSGSRALLFSLIAALARLLLMRAGAGCALPRVPTTPCELRKDIVSASVVDAVQACCVLREIHHDVGARETISRNKTIGLFSYEDVNRFWMREQCVEGVSEPFFLYAIPEKSWKLNFC
ncbi:hypothetical protein NDU88_005801 [Pleurodeles waltl]|uniref:Uncharacterized protein n=1 Tax=Pleurodeles waltl TaxID=8319 RepID=A0AAV7SMP1_PLEWA|nr:hypothetical protein NDU88_005801 [Pleurodeles waltl]